MKSLFLSLAFFAIRLTASSQDVITKISGDDILAKILEVNHTEIKFKRFDNPNGPTYTLVKSNVLMIRYENGTKDIFSQTEDAKINNSGSNEDMRMKGILDAKAYYHGKRNGSGLTFITSCALTPVVGLIPAIACSSVKPSDKYLNYPDAELMKDPDYNSAYINQAHKIKKKEVWSSWAWGLGIWTAGLLIL